eukprot:Protomagalhaensia_sp_Gyna_25__1659@NODE_1862_length_1464_cov_11_890526_g1530_i0_p1_GENE_NODE_1862_length_1464_cov_11_890526_g1530_i0NODE_1862_length_1464_cov_11_890526_g1530_i0_p1_ORF_typecomplete_len418_score44_01Inhibitor_I24/PF10465_9/0_64Inhibitor_I24/PF10465_9/2_5e03_NODE_1862_length_1464_cov_11_890526_g1530_i01831436
MVLSVVATSRQRSPSLLRQWECLLGGCLAFNLNEQERPTAWAYLPMASNTIMIIYDEKPGRRGRCVMYNNPGLEDADQSLWCTWTTHKVNPTPEELQEAEADVRQHVVDCYKKTYEEDKQSQSPPKKSWRRVIAGLFTPKRKWVPEEMPSYVDPLVPEFPLVRDILRKVVSNREKRVTSEKTWWERTTELASIYQDIPNNILVPGVTYTVGRDDTPTVEPTAGMDDPFCGTAKLDINGLSFEYQDQYEGEQLGELLRKEAFPENNNRKLQDVISTVPKRLATGIVLAHWDRAMYCQTFDRLKWYTCPGRQAIPLAPERYSSLVLYEDRGQYRVGSTRGNGVWITARLSSPPPSKSGKKLNWAFHELIQAKEITVVDEASFLARQTPVEALSDASCPPRQEAPNPPNPADEVPDLIEW